MIERITEIYVVLENRPSQIGELCARLAENEINIEAIGVFHETAKLYVKNLNKALKVLGKENYMTELRDVLLCEIENTPGALADLTSKLGDEGINIEYCYATLHPSGGKAAVILDVSKIDEAESLLKG